MCIARVTATKPAHYTISMCGCAGDVCKNSSATRRALPTRRISSYPTERALVRGTDPSATDPNAPGCALHALRLQIPPTIQYQCVGVLGTCAKTAPRRVERYQPAESLAIQPSEKLGLPLPMGTTLAYRCVYTNSMTCWKIFLMFTLILALFAFCPC